MLNKCIQCGGRSLLFGFKDPVGHFCSRDCMWGHYAGDFCDDCKGRSAPTTAGYAAWHGIGTYMFGMGDLCPSCGSSVRMKAFMVLFVPLIPLGRYRIKPISRKALMIRKALPPEEWPAGLPPPRTTPQERARLDGVVKRSNRWMLLAGLFLLINTPLTLPMAFVTARSLWRGPQVLEAQTLEASAAKAKGSMDAYVVKTDCCVDTGLFMETVTKTYGVETGRTRTADFVLAQLGEHWFLAKVEVGQRETNLKGQWEPIPSDVRSALDGLEKGRKPFLQGVLRNMMLDTTEGPVAWFLAAFLLALNLLCAWCLWQWWWRRKPLRHPFYDGLRRRGELKEDRPAIVEP